MSVRIVILAATVFALLVAGPASGAESVAGDSLAETVSADDTEVVSGLVQSEPVLDGALRSGDLTATYWCRTLDVARVHRTLLGFVAFKFWQRKRWCWDYPKIISNQVSTYVTDVDPNFDYKGVIAAWGEWYLWCCGTKYSGQVSYREGKFTNCVLQYGCLGTYYPWVKIRAHSDGSYTYSTGE